MGVQAEVTQQLEHPVAKAQIVDRMPNWMDIIPYFLPCVFVVINPMLYYSGVDNFLIPMWIGYAVLPFLDLLFTNDDTNVSKKYEKAFENDHRFLIPMYALFLCDILMYVWTIYLFISGEVTSWRTTISITLTAAHSNGLTGLMGHELFHKRSPLHKTVGTFTLCKFFYGHFVLEH
jgi:alkane 1-monooxygenase